MNSTIWYSETDIACDNMTHKLASVDGLTSVALESWRSVWPDRVAVVIVNVAGQIPGGTMEDSKVLKGILINKDVTHPKMRRYMYIPCSTVSV